MFASVLGSPITGNGTNVCTSVTVTPAGIAHPVMAGVTLWGCPFHGAFATSPAGYSTLVQANASGFPTMLVREAPTLCIP